MSTRFPAPLAREAQIAGALTPRGVRVPDGFATTAEAYRAFLRETRLEALLEEALSDLDVTQLDALQQAGRRVRSAILGAPLPEPLTEAILEAYRRAAPDQSGDVGCISGLASVAPDGG